MIVPQGLANVKFLLHRVDQHFVAGTAVQSYRLSRSIDLLQLGERVLSFQGEEHAWLQLQEHPEPDFTTWQKVTLLIAPGTEQQTKAQLLRPQEWCLNHGAVQDATIQIDLEEMSISGPALVMAIEPCPEIESGEGRVITCTFQHRSGDVHDLLLESEPHPIGVTGTHPKWSMDRLEWVSVRDLEPGEKVLTLSGITEVTSVLFREEHVPVYNIEVDGDHVYRVGGSASELT